MRHGYEDEPCRGLLELLKTAKVAERVLVARPPFCVGWSISGSQNVARQYAKASREELRRLGPFYGRLGENDRKLLANHAVWAIRATMEASVVDDDANNVSARKVLMDCCFHLVRGLDGHGLEKLLAADSDLFHHDALKPPDGVLDEWTKVCGSIVLETAEAVGKVLKRHLESSSASVPTVADVPITFVSWTLQVFCSHVYHASLYGTGLGTCSICLDAVASAAMSTCLHNLFCPACLAKAARTSNRLRSRTHKTPNRLHKANNNIADNNIWFPCPVCRKIGRIL